MSSNKDIQSIWEYIIKEEYKSDFVKIYAADGEWSKLFRRCHGYIKTELVQDVNNSNRFITIDYWQSLSGFCKMKQNINEQYENLDKQCEKYTFSEKHIGIFNGSFRQ